MKIYSQPISLLKTHLIILCCKTSKEGDKAIQSSKLINKEIKYLLRGFNVADDIQGQIYYDPTTKQPLLLFMRDKKRDWLFWETLIHELNHTVFYYAKQACFEDETEFQARLQEMLFREIRLSLQG